MSHRLPNYLKTYRKKAGLSQNEAAFALGLSDGNKVSRYERGAQKPGLEILLAYETLFGVPARELFGGLYDEIERDTRRRAKALAWRLEKGPEDPLTARKLETLRRVAQPAVPTL